jgi:hypothetical protein
MMPEYSLAYESEKESKEGDIRVYIYVGVEDLAHKNRSRLIKAHR